MTVRINIFSFLDSRVNLHMSCPRGTDPANRYTKKQLKLNGL